MPVHTVRQGECLSSIAQRYGFTDPMALYDHGDNAALRELRPNPHLLLPGDQVQVPEKVLRHCDVPTDGSERFVLKRGRAMFRVVLEDANGEPAADLAWTLTIDGTEHTGTTAADGLVEVAMPPDATEGTLTVQPDPEDPELIHEHPLSFGALDPVDSVTGLQGRLTNMGFGCGEIDGDEGEKTLAALDAFRAREGIEETGPCGDETRAALQDRYGC